jgi:hypothetical protein
MHILVRLYLRTAFLFLALGLVAGLWVEFQQVTGGSISHGMIVAHVHLLLVGFLLMTIFGVAFWLFPRSGRGQPIGPYPHLVAFSYVLLTAGTAIRATTEFFDLQLSAPLWGYVRLGAAPSSRRRARRLPPRPSRRKRRASASPAAGGACTESARRRR